MENRVWHASYETGVPPALAIRELTLPQVLEATAARFPDRTALVFEGYKRTYRQLQAMVERFAANLIASGIEPGDRVAIMLPNLPQTVVAYYGTLRAGAIAVLTNPIYVSREVEHQFNDAGVRAVVVMDTMWMKTVRPVREAIPTLGLVVVTGVADGLAFPKKLLFPLVGKKKGLTCDYPLEAGVIPYKKFMKGAGAPLPPVPSDLEGIANLQYTGGTTGVSKGAILTQRNLTTNAQQCIAWFTGVVEGGEIVLGALPYFHSFGLTVCMNLAVTSGATQVLVANPREIGKLVGIIKKYRPTLFPAVPTLFNAINNFPGIEDADISSIHACLSGSAPLPIEVMEKFEKLTGGKITEGFGLSETSPVTHANPLKGKRKAGSIGIPVSDTDARIVDIETGLRTLGVGEDGELVIRGPQVMRGYWQNQAETEYMLRDGWLYTGDLARMDDEGYFYIVGRKKDMIIAGGFNIYPREIDEVLFTHPKILDAAAVGIPDKHRGETVRAFVVLKPGESATEQEILDYCRERLAPYKTPKTVEFRTELPKTAVGKVLRRVLQDESVKAAAEAPQA